VCRYIFIDKNVDLEPLYKWNLIIKKQETPRDNEDHSPRTNQPQSKTRCPKVAHLAVDRVDQIRRIVKHYLDTEQIMFPRLSPNYSQGADQQETDERKGRGGGE